MIQPCAKGRAVGVALTPDAAAEEWAAATPSPQDSGTPAAPAVAVPPAAAVPLDRKYPAANAEA